MLGTVKAEGVHLAEPDTEASPAPPSLTLHLSVPLPTLTSLPYTPKHPPTGFPGHPQSHCRLRPLLLSLGLQLPPPPQPSQGLGHRGSEKPGPGAGDPGPHPCCSTLS